MGYSGDDHDYCECDHRLADGSTVREVTVKSFSMVMGIRRPGFQLLSVAPPDHSSGASSTSPSDMLADVPCFLPDQIKIYTHVYAPLGILTVFVLLFFNYKRRGRRLNDTEWVEETTQAYVFSSSGSSDSSTYAKLRHSPEHSVSLAQNTLIKNGHRRDEENPVTSSYVNRPGSDDRYPLPIHAQYPSHPRLSRTAGRRALDTPTSGGNGLFSLLGPARACCTWWTSACEQTWYSRALKDFCDIAWPPLIVYITISLWLFRR